MSRVAVLAGRGKTGRAVGAALAARGAVPVPLGSAEVAGSAGVTGSGRLAEALTGCAAVYLAAPNLHPDEPGLVAAVLEAARDAGVPRVVYHSVAAPYAPAMPHHLGKARAEDLVRRSGLAWSILQPCAYTQNFLPALASASPALAVPYDTGRLFGLVDLADIGEAAATVLLDAVHIGATYELGGPALVSVGDVAAAAGSLLGREVPAFRVDPSAWAAGPGAGLSARERDWLLAMFGYYDAYGLPAGPIPLAGLLGRTPRSVPQTLARELAP